MDYVKFHKQKQRDRNDYNESWVFKYVVPPYSSFLNPMFNKLEEYVKRQNPNSESELLEIIGNGFDLITTYDCKSFFGNIFSYIPQFINSEIM